MNAESRFLAIAGRCAIAAPILQLSIDVFHITTHRDFEFTLGMWLAFALFVPAVIGFAYWLAKRGSRKAKGCPRRATSLAMIKTIKPQRPTTDQRARKSAHSLSEVPPGSEVTGP